MSTVVRLKLKDAFPYYEVDGIIYFQGSGQLIEIGEATDELRSLLALLDGTNDTPALQRAVAERHPNVSAEDVKEVLSALDSVGLLENAAAPELLTEYEQERWSRNLGFFQTYSDLTVGKSELQCRLADCRVALLGLGGIGSHVLFDLAAIGIRNVRLVDFDAIELSNLNRQILYRESDIGQQKVETARQRILEFNSSMKVDTIEMKLGSAEDIRSVVEGYDVAIAAVDRPKMHIVDWLNAGCVAARTTLIAGGVDTQRALYFTVIPGLSGCVACWEGQASDTDPVAAEISAQMRIIEEQQRPGERFGQDYAAFTPLVSVQTASVVAELVRIATGIEPPVALSKLIEIRFADFVARPAETWTRSPDCMVCGTVDEPDVRWQRNTI